MSGASSGSTSFDGLQVLVTGGTGGLGASVVRALLDAGAHVTVPFPEKEPQGRFAELRHERLVKVASIDLTQESQVTALYAGLPALWASIHLTGGFAMKPIVETSLAELRAQVSLNLETCFLSCREAVKTLRARPAAGQRGGRIVNVAARPALAPTGGMIAYSTAKAGVASLTQCLAAEVLAEGILVNAVVPSIIDTPVNRKSMPDADFSAWPKAEQIAETIRFLASPANALTSGTLVPVYGRA
jgi:NAD(P)-dependent dehydrogenase (short-subunit alcohol dehydrogenase family)